MAWPTLQVAKDVKLTRAVLGDKLSIPAVAQALKNVYGFEPTLKRQGSLDELGTTMQSRFKEDPSNIFAWLSMLVCRDAVEGHSAR